MILGAVAQFFDPKLYEFPIPRPGELRAEPRCAFDMDDWDGPKEAFVSMSFGDYRIFYKRTCIG